jgi:hypothetical protein
MCPPAGGNAQGLASLCQLSSVMKRSRFLQTCPRSKSSKRAHRKGSALCIGTVRGPAFLAQASTRCVFRLELLELSLSVSIGPSRCSARVGGAALRGCPNSIGIGGRLPSERVAGLRRFRGRIGSDYTAAPRSRSRAVVVYARMLERHIRDDEASGLLACQRRATDWESNRAGVRRKEQRRPCYYMHIQVKLNLSSQSRRDLDTSRGAAAPVAQGLHIERGDCSGRHIACHRAPLKSASGDTTNALMPAYAYKCQADR